MSTTRSAGPKAPATDGRRPEALVLWGHGRAGGPGVLTTHARRLAASAAYAEVAASCLRGRPELAETVDRLAAPRIRLVPVLMADGFLARNALTAAIDGLGRDAARLWLAPVLGRHPRLAELMSARALAAVEARGWRADETTLLVVGHGTPRDANSRATAHVHAVSIARAGRFRRVAAGFLEDAPAVAETAVAGDERFVAVGLFADDGPHGSDDVRAALAALERPWVYAGPVGHALEIAELILEQAALAAPQLAMA